MGRPRLVRYTRRLIPGEQGAKSLTVFGIEFEDGPAESGMADGEREIFTIREHVERLLAADSRERERAFIERAARLRADVLARLDQFRDEIGQIVSRDNDLRLAGDEHDAGAPRGQQDTHAEEIAESAAKPAP